MARPAMPPSARSSGRWPVKFLLPFGFGMLALQGISEIIKNVAALLGVEDMKHKYQAPLQ